jgi:ABC-type transport system involved in multi-copper enzyme maturation permease subunit
LTAVLLIAFYSVGIWFQAWEEPAYHIAFAAIVLLLGLLRMTVDAAGTIAREKEGRTLTVLLMTPISDGEIIRQKIMAIVRKSLPTWAILGGHLLIFSVLGYLHPLAFPAVAITIASSAVLLTGLGLFMSSICRSSTVAISWSCAIPLVSWFMNPFLAFSNPGLWIGFILSSHIAWNQGGFFRISVFILFNIVYIGLGIALAAISIPMMRHRLFSTVT